MRYYLDFEKPIEEMETKVEELRRLTNGRNLNLGAEIKKLERKVKELRSQIFSRLTPWQKTLLARHPERPYTLDFINMIATNFIELHGDRRFADDPAIIAGFADVGGISFLIVGHQKGRGVKERIVRNFGQPNPEGYRKALRLMKLAERFKKPIITFIDTPGAYPGVGAEERGQAEAIATNLMEMCQLKTPIISVVIGEGGSGGAIALSVADRLFMLEHAVYSVISPEGCAAILWKKNGDVGITDFSMAADALKITAQDLLAAKTIDEIIPEPLGGAHREPETTAKNVQETILRAYEELKIKTPAKLVEERYKKLRRLGGYLAGE